jgi:hypothetical protein
MLWLKQNIAFSRTAFTNSAVEPKVINIKHRPSQNFQVALYDEGFHGF